MSLTRELLPEPLTPVTQMNASSGKTTSTLRRLLWRAPTILRVFFPRSRRDRDGDCQFAGQILSGQAFGRFAKVFERSLRDDFAAANPRPRTEIDDVIGRAHRFLVVFDDDHRVSLVAEVLEAVEQQAVVARVQADRRLVEDVNHSDESATNLGREANALAFSTGECRAARSSVR